MSVNSVGREKNNNIGSSLSQFLSNNRIIVVGSIILVFLVIGGLIAFFSYKDNIKSKVVLMSEEIDQAYINWLRADEKDKKEKEDNFFKLAQEANKKYPKSFAVQRSLYSTGLYYLEKKKYAEAGESFLELADNYEKSYLAPESYFNAASAFEMNKDYDKALDCLIKLLDKYKTDSPVAPEACFNIARIYDTRGDKAKAIEYFDMLLTDFPESEWSGVAQTRLIELKIKD